ncbi:hypothetical protein ACFQZC_25025 [Streptacidiphilus monticola]
MTVPERQGLETVDILRLRGGCGAVLHRGDGGSSSTLSFLVPPGAAAGWELPAEASCTDLPVPGEAGSWLLPPSGGSTLTDPDRLHAALDEAARTLAALDDV